MNDASVFRGARFTASGMSAHRTWFALALIATAAFVGCGGGGSSTGTVAGTPATGSFTASFSFSIPAASPSAALRRPAYISPSSRSLVINIVYPGATVPGLVINLNPLPPGCTTVDGLTTCNVSVVAQSTAKTFIVTFYDGANGQGNALSTSSVAVPPAPNGVATIDLLLEGVVARVALGLQPALAFGQPGASTLVVTPFDADGNVIGGSAPYSAPIQLHTSSAALTLSATSVAGPSTVITVTYNGTLDPTLLIVAQPVGGKPADLAPFSPSSTPVPTPTPTPTPAPLTALPPTSPQLTQLGASTVSVQEAGYRGQYTVQSSNTNVITVTTPVSSTSDVTAIPIDVVGAGMANVTVTDGYGQSVVFAVTVTLTPITIQADHRGASQR